MNPELKPATAVTRAEILAGLRMLGLKPGDLAQVHSSLKSFGRVDGGPDAVIDACLDAVGPAGTLMMPTFNHGQREAYETPECIFDIKGTRSVNGLITETFRKRAGVKRSFHPSHPYAAFGPLAEWLIAEHLHLDCFDARSPLGKLCAMNGWIVLLGCGMNACTAVHVAQTIYGMPCVGQRQNPWPMRDPKTCSVNTGWTVIWRDGACPFEFEPVEKRLRERGQFHEIKIGDATVQALRGPHVITAAVELCHEYCPTCKRRPILATGSAAL